MKPFKHIFLKLCSMGAFVLLAVWLLQSAKINSDVDSNNTSTTPTTALSYFDTAAESQSSAVSETDLDPVTIVRVVDGDTVIVENLKNEQIRVRFIGIDTPESVNPDESKNTEEGVAASEYTKSRLIPGNTIYLQYDEQRYDQYDRTLAYIWLQSDVDISNPDDVKSYMYNAELIISGYAVAKEYPPNTLYSELFTSLEQEYQ